MSSVTVEKIFNPFDRQSRDVLTVEHTGQTLQDLVWQQFPADVAVTVSVNGRAVTGDLTTTRVAPNDCVLIMPAIHGGDTGKNILRVVAMIVVAAVAGWTGFGATGFAAYYGSNLAGFAAAALVSVAGGMLVNLTLPPKEAR